MTLILWLQVTWEDRTSLSTCFRLVRIGFESQPTSLPTPSKVLLTPWITNDIKKPSGNRTWAQNKFLQRGRNGQWKDTKRFFYIPLITSDIIRVHSSDLNIGKHQNEGECNFDDCEWQRRVCWSLEVDFLVLLRCQWKKNRLLHIKAMGSIVTSSHIVKTEVEKASLSHSRRFRSLMHRETHNAWSQVSTC
jgi:hypothetical protein